MFSARLNRLYNAVVNSSNIRWTLYPVVTDKMVAGVNLPTDNNLVATAWGAWTEVFAAATITADFWLCGLQVLLTDGTSDEQRAVQIGSGIITAAVALADWAFFLTAKATPQLGPLLLPHPILVAGGSAMCGRSAQATKEAAKNQTVAILCATAL